MGHPHPIPRRAEAQRSPIMWFPFIYVYTLRRRTSEFGVVTYGEVHVLGVQPRHCVLHNASPVVKVVM